MLLERGFDPNQRAVYNGRDGRTPLMMAEERHIPLLLSYEANVSLKNDEGETALSEAKRKGYSSATLRLLVQHKQHH